MFNWKLPHGVVTEIITTVLYRWNYTFLICVSNLDNKLLLSAHYLLNPVGRVLEKLKCSHVVRNSPHFIKTEGSLPHSQVPTTCPSPQPDKSSPFPPQTHFLEIHLHITLPSTPGSSKWLSTYYKNQKASSFRTLHLREFRCVFRRYGGFELWARRLINFTNNGLPQAPQGSVCGLVPKIRTSFLPHSFLFFSYLRSKHPTLYLLRYCQCR
jgi:hypothetical protein